MTLLTHATNLPKGKLSITVRIYIFVFLRVITIQAQVAHLYLEVFIAVDSALRSWSVTRNPGDDPRNDTQVFTAPRLLPEFNDW